MCVLRTQQPGVESAVEGHVSSQNHMQSCRQDPDHVRASRLNTTEQDVCDCYVSFIHTFTDIYVHTSKHKGGRELFASWQMLQHCSTYEDMSTVLTITVFPNKVSAYSDDVLIYR